MYSLSDKEGNKLALRPEMTASLARLVLNRTNVQIGQVRESLPLKWYSILPCWRCETTQRGRKREFYQWNMDIVGSDSVNAEAELLAASVDFFRRVGLGPDIVQIRINSRPAFESLLYKFGVGKENFVETTRIIDGLEKIKDEEAISKLTQVGLSLESATKLLAALRNMSNPKLAEILGPESTDVVQDLVRLFELSEAYGFRDYLKFDATIVRGLNYYTGIVWEAFAAEKYGLRAIMGGGRYDRLMAVHGGEKCQIPCVGFGLGDCVIMELLKACKKLPDCSKPDGVDYVVCAYNPNLYGISAGIAQNLRQNGSTVDLMLAPKRKVRASFNQADRKGARRVVFVAPREVEKSIVRVKDLRLKASCDGKGLQVDCPIDQLDQLDDRLETAKNGTPGLFRAGVFVAVVLVACVGISQGLRA